MVTITSISNVNYAKYDEVWAIVRSLKYANPNTRHVPELSPSWKLFQKYLSLQKEGNWNEETFRTIYVPQFLKEMQGTEQQRLLNELLHTKKHICLVCFCKIEELCHRSIVGGILQGAGLTVYGLSQDYSHYYDLWKKNVPVSTKRITNYNKNVSCFNKENLTKDDLPTMCFTGRRPKDLCGYDAAKYQTFVYDLMKLLYDEFYLKSGIRRFISGGAQGFDQMVFWAVDIMKKTYGCTDVQNVVFVPFEGQEVRWTEKGLFSQADYWKMIQYADQVVVISENNNMEAFHTRNHVMCNQSSICLGLYPNDNWHMEKGGTAECLRYAKNHCPNTYRLNYTIDSLGLHIGKITVA